MSDNNDSNNPTAANSEMTEAPSHPPESPIRILKGNPSDEDIAALVTVLASVGSAPESQPTERTRWGLAVDKLRYGTSEYQRLTLQQMTHMKKR